jgi:hypothetical protein
MSEQLLETLWSVLLAMPEVTRQHHPSITQFRCNLTDYVEELHEFEKDTNKISVDQIMNLFIRSISWVYKARHLFQMIMTNSPTSTAPIRDLVCIQIEHNRTAGGAGSRFSSEMIASFKGTLYPCDVLWSLKTFADWYIHLDCGDKSGHSLCGQWLRRYFRDVPYFLTFTFEGHNNLDMSGDVAYYPEYIDFPQEKVQNPKNQQLELFIVVLQCETTERFSALVKRGSIWLRVCGDQEQIVDDYKAIIEKTFKGKEEQAWMVIYRNCDQKLRDRYNGNVICNTNHFSDMVFVFGQK